MVMTRPRMVLNIGLRVPLGWESQVSCYGGRGGVNHVNPPRSRSVIAQKPKHNRVCQLSGQAPNPLILDDTRPAMASSRRSTPAREWRPIVLVRPELPPYFAARF